MLGREPSGIHDGVWTPWSTCGPTCLHAGPVRTTSTTVLGDHEEYHGDTQRDVLRNNFHDDVTWDHLIDPPLSLEPQLLTVHHLDGDKANLAWWNLTALCQVCHLEIQAKVVMERVYPFEHSDWFKLTWLATTRRCISARTSTVHRSTRGSTSCLRLSVCCKPC